MVMDTGGGLIHLLLGDGTFRALSLGDSSEQPALADGDVDRFIMTGSGEVYAASGLGIVKWDGSSWISVASVTSTDGGTEALAMASAWGFGRERFLEDLEKKYEKYESTEKYEQVWKSTEKCMKKCT